MDANAAANFCWCPQSHRSAAQPHQVGPLSAEQGPPVRRQRGGAPPRPRAGSPGSPQGRRPDCRPCRSERRWIEAAGGRVMELGPPSTRVTGLGCSPGCRVERHAGYPSHHRGRAPSQRMEGPLVSANATVGTGTPPAATNACSRTDWSAGRRHRLQVIHVDEPRTGPHSTVHEPPATASGWASASPWCRPICASAHAGEGPAAARRAGPSPPHAITDASAACGRVKHVIGRYLVPGMRAEAWTVPRDPAAPQATRQELDSRSNAFYF